MTKTFNDIATEAGKVDEWLKPCKQCGSSNLRHKAYNIHNKEVYTITCQDCWAKACMSLVSRGATKSQAGVEWNERNESR